MVALPKSAAVSDNAVKKGGDSTPPLVQQVERRLLVRHHDGNPVGQRRPVNLTAMGQSSSKLEPQLCDNGLIIWQQGAEWI
eukprot:scaffold143976_cov43-Attheya_sp.AAC.1